MAAEHEAEDNSPEKIALDLLRTIAHIEKRTLHSGPADGWTAADRQWLLRTYAECMLTVRGALRPPPAF